MVVEADGQVYRFDRYWRYTRVTHPVGSGSAVESYPSDLVGPGILLFPFLEAAWWVFPALVTGVGAVVHYRRSRRPTALLGGGLAVAFLYGVAVRQHAARVRRTAGPARTRADRAAAAGVPRGPDAPPGWTWPFPCWSRTHPRSCRR
jgi:hypothetical protein